MVAEPYVPIPDPKTFPLAERGMVYVGAELTGLLIGDAVMGLLYRHGLLQVNLQDDSSEAGLDGVWVMQGYLNWANEDIRVRRLETELKRPLLEKVFRSSMSNAFQHTHPTSMGPPSPPTHKGKTK